MELQKNTLEKIKKFNEAKKNGYDEPWIIKNLFGRNKKRYSDWTIKHKEHLTFTHEIIGKIEIIEPLPLKEEKKEAGLELVNSPEEYKAFKELMALFMEGKIQTKETNSNITEKLVISKDTFNGHDIVQKTLRVSKQLDQDLTTFAKYEGFTKVEVLNFAIKEFLEKYN